MEDVDSQNVKHELMSEIQKAVEVVASEKRSLKMKSLSRFEPEKVVRILYLYSQGNSISRIKKRYGIKRETIASVLVDYADYIGKWKELGGRLAAISYMRLSSIEEDMLESIQNRMDSNELVPGFKDLKDLAIAKSIASKEALTARGEASEITESRKTYKHEDYEETMKKVRERLGNRG